MKSYNFEVVGAFVVVFFSQPLALVLTLMPF